MATILIAILATLTAVGMAVIISRLMERRRLYWREVASERRRREDARLSEYRARTRDLAHAR